MHGLYLQRREHSGTRETCSAEETVSAFASDCRPRMCREERYRGTDFFREDIPHFHCSVGVAASREINYRS